MAMGRARAAKLRGGHIGNQRKGAVVLLAADLVKMRIMEPAVWRIRKDARYVESWSCAVIPNHPRIMKTP
jgi:hypothetical protein